MKWLDIVLIIILAVAAFLGLKAGIIKAVLSLVGLIVSVILAGHYYTPLSDQLTFISQTSIAKATAFAIILIGTMLIATVLAWLLTRITSVIMLGWVNHLGGAIMGLALGALFCSALLAVWVKYLGAGETIAGAGLATLLLDRLPMVLSLLPAEFDAIRSFFQ